MTRSLASLFATLLLVGCSESPGDRPVGDGSLADADLGPCEHPEVTIQCADGLCTVPAGCYFMGAPLAEPCRGDDEPPHRVTLTRAFEIQQSEATQAQFEAAMGYNPSHFAGCADCPAESLSWHEAASYCNALSEQKGLPRCYSCEGEQESTVCAQTSAAQCAGFRLPTEAEWEYAARAGTKTGTYAGDVAECNNTEPALAAIAWYEQNSGAKTHPTSEKQENPWGLVDMLGNVSEWTHDWYQGDPSIDAQTDPEGPQVGSSKVVRGGSWNQRPLLQRAASRYQEATVARSSEIGVRCLRAK